MPITSHVLAVDQGTTGTTAVVVGEDGLAAGTGYAGLRQHFPRPGWVEHDPDDIWQSVVTAAGAALADSGVAPTDVGALGITNQRETAVLWDRATGLPVHNAVVWQDRRTAGTCRRLSADGVSDLVRRRTGLPLDPYFSATKVAWMLDHVAGLRHRAEAGELAFGTIDSWLVWKLTGGAVHATDATNASRTLLMDLGTVAWDDELCEVFGVPRAVLPEIRPSQHVFGETGAALAEVLGAVSLPVAAVLGDQQAALFAQGCVEPGQTKSTYGTGSFVLSHAGTSLPAAGRETSRLVTTVAGCAGDQTIEYALEGSIFVTGAAVQWLRDGLGVIAGAAETGELAASIDGNDDVWFVPALTGLGAPTWDPLARGTLIGLTRGTTRAHLARAVLESIAYQTLDVVETMEAESGRALAELRADGGASANTWLMQFQADVLGVPVDVAASTEMTSLGSAYLAGLTTGLWSDRSELARRRRSAARYEPAMSSRRRSELRDRWHQALARSRGWAREGA